MPRSHKDILAGSAFVGFGMAFAVLSVGYGIGTTVRMGPGYFPFFLGVALVLLGALIVARGLLAGEEGAIGVIPWRAVTLILGAIVVFGLTVRGLGLVPSTFLTALMSAFASRRAGLLPALAIAIGLTVLCVLIFVIALSLRLPLVGTWIRV
jgi:Tripartite tricarboxylate transporter TctB family